jgi:AcrR family transcriptional regulator
MAVKGVTRQHTHLEEAGENATRQKIVACTISILATEGPEKLSAFSVAKRASVRRSHVVYYYPQKKDLLAAAVSEVIGRGQEMVLVAVAGKKTAVECLDAYIDSLFQWLVKFPEHASVMGMLHYYGAVGAEFKELNAKVREVGEARIADMLHFGKRGTPNQRERELAKLIRELLIGNLTNVISSTDSSQLLADCQKLKKAVFGLVDTYQESKKP